MTDLKLKLVTQDQKGRTVAVQDYATKIAVITDPEQTVSEIINVDTVRIVAFMVTGIEKVFQANFVIGGVDSAGTFHASPTQHPALFAVNEHQEPEWWAANIEGRTIYDLDEILQWINDAGAVHRAGKDLWKMPGLVSYYEGQPPPDLAPPPPIASEHVPGVIPALGPFPPMPSPKDDAP